MDQMKQRFVNAVNGSLFAAPDSTAKTELVEELADNLYRRYLDMTAAGEAEGKAFERALDELGDTDELVEYLKSLAPDESIPKLTLYPEGVDNVVERAMQTAKEAMNAAQEALRKAGKGLYWRSDDGQFEVHLDACDDDHGEHPVGGDHGDEAFEELEDLEEEAFEDEEIGEEGIPSEGLRGIDIQTTGGDVTIHLIDEEDAPICLEDYDGLEIKRTDDNVLAIRQENTASSNFFFGHGIFAADVELYIPRRCWDFIQVSVVNGDVSVEDGIEVERLSVRSTSGDLTAHCDRCGKLTFKSASGDCRVSGLTGEAAVETLSGDVTVHGHLKQVRLKSTSGDVETQGSFARGEFSTLSGDLRLETSRLPEELEVNTTSGDCQIYLPADRGFTLRCKSTSGDLRSQFKFQRTERGHAYLDGGDRTFRIATTSGDIRLRKF